MAIRDDIINQINGIPLNNEIEGIKSVKTILDLSNNPAIFLDIIREDVQNNKGILLNKFPSAAKQLVKFLMEAPVNELTYLANTVSDFPITSDEVSVFFQENKDKAFSLIKQVGTDAVNSLASQLQGRLANEIKAVNTIINTINSASGWSDLLSQPQIFLTTIQALPDEAISVFTPFLESAGLGNLAKEVVPILDGINVITNLTTNSDRILEFIREPKKILDVIQGFPKDSVIYNEILSTLPDTETQNFFNDLHSGNIKSWPAFFRSHSNFLTQHFPGSANVLKLFENFAVLPTIIEGLKNPQETGTELLLEAIHIETNLPLQKSDFTNAETIAKTFGKIAAIRILETHSNLPVSTDELDLSAQALIKAFEQQDLIEIEQTLGEFVATGVFYQIKSKYAAFEILQPLADSFISGKTSIPTDEIAKKLVAGTIYFAAAVSTGGLSTVQQLGLSLIGGTTSDWSVDLTIDAWGTIKEHFQGTKNMLDRLFDGEDRDKDFYPETSMSKGSDIEVVYKGEVDDVEVRSPVSGKILSYDISTGEICIESNKDGTIHVISGLDSNAMKFMEQSFAKYSKGTGTESLEAGSTIGFMIVTSGSGNKAEGTIHYEILLGEKFGALNKEVRVDPTDYWEEGGEMHLEVHTNDKWGNNDVDLDNGEIEAFQINANVKFDREVKVDLLIDGSTSVTFDGGYQGSEFTLNSDGSPKDIYLHDKGGGTTDTAIVKILTGGWNRDDEKPGFITRIGLDSEGGIAAQQTTETVDSLHVEDSQVGTAISSGTLATLQDWLSDTQQFLADYDSFIDGVDEEVIEADDFSYLGAFLVADLGDQYQANGDHFSYLEELMLRNPVSSWSETALSAVITDQQTVDKLNEINQRFQQVNEVVIKYAEDHENDAPENYSDIAHQFESNQSQFEALQANPSDPKTLYQTLSMWDRMRMILTGGHKSEVVCDFSYSENNSEGIHGGTDLQLFNPEQSLFSPLKGKIHLATANSLWITRQDGSIHKWSNLRVSQSIFSQYQAFEASNGQIERPSITLNDTIGESLYGGEVISYEIYALGDPTADVSTWPKFNPEEYWERGCLGLEVVTATGTEGIAVEEGSQEQLTFRLKVGHTGEIKLKLRFNYEGTAEEDRVFAFYYETLGADGSRVQHYESELEVTFPATEADGSDQ
ncbi:hypothetical protein WDW89_20020, partial [Deltaproteobacteria bacterium TL4]